MRICLVIMRLSSAARNSAVRATSSASSQWLEQLAADEIVRPAPSSYQSRSWRLGDHRAGRDRVDADVVGAEVAGERVGEADDAGLGGRVGDEVRAAVIQAIEEKLTIEPQPELAHVRMHRLRGEELVPEVDVHRAVPVLGRDLGDRLCARRWRRC